MFVIVHFCIKKTTKKNKPEMAAFAARAADGNKIKAYSLGQCLNETSLKKQKNKNGCSFSRKYYLKEQNKANH